MTDEDLKTISGTDAALYIIFLRYAAKFFGAITLVNIIIIIPIYCSGKPLKHDDVDHNESLSELSILTILNITASHSKVGAVYILILIIYSTFALTMAFYYWKKSSEWRFRMHSHMDPF